MFVPRYKYSDQDIRNAVANSTSIYGVLRYLGMRITGGQHSHISGRIRKLGLDKSHFISHLGTNKGKKFDRLSPDEILIIRTVDYRPSGKMLTRALLSKNVQYKCAVCLCDGLWIGKPLTLHVDHIDGNWKDNRITNLRFMCPNCHQQTETFGSKNTGV